MTDGVRNITMHPVKEIYLHGDVISAMADGNPPAKYFWTILHTTEVGPTCRNIPLQYRNTLFQNLRVKVTFRWSISILELELEFYLFDRQVHHSGEIIS